MAVNKIGIHLGLNEIQASEVELCVAEAVTNAIRHAWHGEPGHTVSIAVSAQKNELRIDISESGTPMGVEHSQRLRDTREAEPETGDRSLLAEGGRGLQIIRDLMDKAEYTREGSVNCLRLTKRIHSAQAN
jgi:serine/threonine-protein kinase RsbW